MWLYLIRHGQSEANAGLDVGTDPKLTDLGRRQAMWTANRLRGEGIEALYSSPMRRALETATIIGEALGLTPTVWVNLCELRTYEDFTGLPRSMLAALFPSVVLPPQVTEAGWWDGRAETIEDADTRAAVVLRLLESAHPSPRARLAVITHGLFGALMLAHAMGDATGNLVAWHQNNCGISIVRIGDGPPGLVCLNDLSHIPPECVT
jgi:broad specificity phosphatase PhoE